MKHANDNQYGVFSRDNLMILVIMACLAAISILTMYEILDTLKSMPWPNSAVNGTLS